MDGYSCVLPSKGKKRLVEQLGAQDLQFQVEFYLFMDKTLAHGWDTGQRLETLDGRYHTYALQVKPGDRRLAMLAREIGGKVYVYLGLYLPGDLSPVEAVYREACSALQLTDPRRDT